MNNLENYFNDNYVEYAKYLDYKLSDIDLISNPNNLLEAFYKSRKDVSWKSSVQYFETNLIRNISKISTDLNNDNYKRKDLVSFTLQERGKKRYIKSHNIVDRIVDRSFTDNLLIPITIPYLIYDNGSSIQGKGLSFSRKRFEEHMRSAYKQYGYDCYILLIDFSKYFDNINHQYLIDMYSKILEPAYLNFLINALKEYEVDLSYKTDEEFEIITNSIFNSLDYYNEINNNKDLKLDKSKIMRKSMGIGSQLSQISGLYYPHNIDNYIKHVLRIPYYGRYMDDSYIIMNNKDDLIYVLTLLDELCIQYDIHINQKKTCIKRLDDWIPYLKINYKILDTGRLIRKVNSDSFHRERRRLLKFKHLSDRGILNVEDIVNYYKGWRGSYEEFDSGYELDKMDHYFYDIFNIWPLC